MPLRGRIASVMTILICRELSLLYFDRLAILFAWIEHLSEKLWPFEFLDSFHCSISSVSIYYVLELYNRVKSFYHLNFSNTSVIQFRAPRYIMHLNRTSLWKVMTIWISRELPLLYFERLAILFAWFEHLSEKLWPFEFLDSFRCSILSVSIYHILELYIRVKIITIWISRQLPLVNFQHLDILCA